MKNFKKSMLFGLLVCGLNTVHAQDPPLYQRAIHVLYLSNKLGLSLKSIRYDGGRGDVWIGSRRGLSIDDNYLKDTDNSILHMQLIIYKNLGSGRNISDSSIMKINLFFDNTKEEIQYFLSIPEFKPGIINVTIPYTEAKKQKKLSFSYPDGDAYDITGMVFPNGK